MTDREPAQVGGRFNARWVREVLILAVCYFATARLGLLLAMPGGHVSPVWPPAGVALAALLLRGKELWPGVWLGSFAANFWDFSGRSGDWLPRLTTPAIMAVGATLAAYLGWLWVRATVGDRQPLNSARGVFALILLGGLASGVVSATVGVGALVANGFAPFEAAPSSWLTWWLGDAAGVLVVAPFLLAWTPGGEPVERPRRLEFGLGLALTGVVAYFVFVDRQFSVFQHRALPFLLGPLIIWVAVRIGQRGAVSAAALIALLATMGTVQGSGPFQPGARNEALLILELFLMVTVATALLLSAILLERRQAEAARRLALSEVEAQVRVRTEALAQREEIAQQRLQLAERSRTALLSILEDERIADRALREAETHLRLATEAGRVGIWDWDLKTETITWSALHEKLFGMKPGEFDGRFASFEKRIHPDDRAAVQLAMQSAVENRRSIENEFRVLMPAGSIRWMASKGRAYFGADGKAVRIAGIVQDVTERKLAESVIRHLNRVYVFLSEINQTIVRERDPARVLEIACQIAVEKGDFMLAWIGLLDPVTGEHHFVSHARAANPPDGAADPDRHLTVENIFIAEMLQTGGTVICHSVANDPRAEAWRGPPLAMGYRGVIVLPLKVDEKLAGSFTLFVDRDDFFNEGEVRLLDGLAGDLGFAIEVGRREAERRRSEQVLSWEKSALELSSGAASEKEKLDGIVLGLESLLPGSICSVLLLDAEGARFRHGAAPNLPEAYTKILDGMEVGPDVGSCGYAMHHNRQTITEDIALDPLWAKYREFVLGLGLRACWSTPFCDHRGKLLGSIAVYYPTARAPAPGDLELLTRASHLVAIVVERRRNEDRISRQAAFPALNPNPVFEFSADGKLVYANAAAGALASNLGFGEVNELLPAATPEIVVAALGSGRPRLRFETKHGARTLTWSFFPIASLQTVHCYVIEITERLNLEEQFRQSQKMEAIGQLSGGVAHDFNNIITVIKGRAALLLRELPTDSVQAASMHEIEDAADRAATLTRQLLAFSRRQVMQQRDLDLNEAVHTIIGMLRRLLGEQVKVTLGFSAEALWTHADPGMIEQVLINLAVNARDAMPEGGVLTIETSSERVDDPVVRRWPHALPGPFVKLAVRDTGTGIAPEIIARIFEPFFTTKGVGEGTGLGLATVYGIVQQHCGGIEVTSTVGQGTTFGIFLPRIAAPDSVAPEALAKPEIKGGIETILLVEDEQAVQQVAQLVLERMGYEILVAASGAEALKVWEVHRDKIKLLLTDLVMPDGVNGHELARRLKLEKPSLRVIYSSGYSASVAGRDFPLDANANFLGKPYDIDQLTAIVRSALDRDASGHPFGD